MLALIIGMLIEMFLESCVVKSVCERLTISENLGTRRTSSNVSPSLMLMKPHILEKKTIISLSCIYDNL